MKIIEKEVQKHRKFTPKVGKSIPKCWKIGPYNELVAKWSPQRLWEGSGWIGPETGAAKRRKREPNSRPVEHLGSRNWVQKSKNDGKKYEKIDAEKTSRNNARMGGK